MVRGNTLVQIFHYLSRSQYRKVFLLLPGAYTQRMVQAQAHENYENFSKIEWSKHLLDVLDSPG